MAKIVLPLLVSLLTSLTHGCGYNLIKGTDKASRPDPDTVTIQGVDPVTKRVLAPGTRNLHAYRMGIYYNNLNNFIDINPSLSSKAELSKRVLNRTSTYINNYIQVTYFDTMTVTGPFSCGGTSYNTMTGSWDFLLLVVPENNSGTSYFAAAAPCADDSLTGRPIVGSYLLNFAYLGTAPRTEYTYFFVFMHELTHLLGFMESYYTKYLKSDGVTRYTAAEAKTTTTISGKTFTLLKYPALVTFAKSYYGCDTLTGVPVENDGGSGSAGSHWEKTFFPNEYMNPTIEDYPLISEFTTTLLKITGWYTISSTAPQDYTWGKGAGCSFYNICPSTAGYCASSNSGNQYCAADYRSKAYCATSTSFTDVCGIIRSSTSICEIRMPLDQPVKTASETYGPNARCIEYQESSTSRIVPNCHAVSCSGSTLTITTATGTSYICSSAGSLISVGGTYSIKCPDPVDFCSTLSTKCSDDCYTDGMGICMKGGTCFCFKGLGSSGKCNVDIAFMNNGTIPTTLAADSMNGNTTSSNSTNRTTSNSYTSVVASVWLLIIIAFYYL